MRVLVAGASGALGRPLVSQLIERGHEVFGTTRQRPESIEELGAKPVIADAFDRDGFVEAIVETAPEGVIHALTRIPKAAVVSPRRLKINDRLRVEGTRNLVEGCKAAGVKRIVAESITFAFHGRSEDRMKPLEGMGSFQGPVDAALSLERQVIEAGGIVLRYGYFYGPDTSISDLWPGALKRRTLPIIGKGTGWWSFIHVDDAASGTVAALERGQAGEIYNIVDDEPILASEALATIAEASGSPRPFRLPNVGPYYARHYFNRSSGASNAKAKAELGWSPKYSSLREGFRDG